MSTVNSTQIRIELGVKSDLEGRRDQHGKKTHSDTIALLLHMVGSYEDDAKERYEQDRQEQQRRADEDVVLGAIRKKTLVDLQAKLKLGSLNQVVDLLVHHFETSETISKETLIFARSLT